jgi:hypothetical protein
MKSEMNTKAKSADIKAAPKKKASLKGITKSSAMISPRLASNHNETLLTH